MELARQRPDPGIWPVSAGQEMSRTAPSGLTRRQKAAVIIGVLGTEAAGPVLERLDETSLRNSTHAMSGLNRIDATQVRATIAEFLSELEQDDEAVRGGLRRLRSSHSRLREAPLSAALVALDTRTGDVLAYVGGDPANGSDRFDRVRRQEPHQQKTAECQG